MRMLYEEWVNFPWKGVNVEKVLICRSCSCVCLLGTVCPIMMLQCLFHIYTLKTPRSAWPGKGSIGVILRSGSTVTRNVVSFLQTWQIKGPDWPSSGSYSESSWPGMEFGPNGPFSESSLTLVFFFLLVLPGLVSLPLTRKVPLELLVSWSCFSASFLVIFSKNQLKFEGKVKI